MDNRYFWRSLSTGGAFSLIFPGVSGLSLALLALVAVSLGMADDSVPAMSGPGPIWGSFLIGFVFHFPIALVTGLGLAVISGRIRSGIAWIGWATLSGALLSFMALLLVLRSAMSGQPFWDMFGLALSMSVISAIGSAAAGLATMALRPRPASPPVAQTFA